MQERKRYLRKEMPEFIGRYIIENHIPPTVDDVAGHFHVSKETVHKYLIKLDEAGVIPYRHRIGIPYWMFREKTKGAG